MKKKIVVAAVCSLMALGQGVSGQNVSQSQSPSAQPQPQPKQQKSKPVRIQGSPKPASGGGRKAEGGGRKDQNQGQDQGRGNVQNQKGGNANANANPNTIRPSYAEIRQRHRKERHDQNWWKQHYTVIVLVGGGYYYWDAGYWCPAWGYDPAYETYDYDGPIFTYGNLLPDQVIVNVQRALKQLGYYAGGTTGSLGPSTRQALANFQEANGLEVTGAIDAATVEALGLY